MAFTRSYLRSLNLTDEQVQAVIEEHTAVTDSLKKFKEDAEKLPEVQKELDKAKQDLADANTKLETAENWKKKYEEEHTSYDDFKKQVENDKAIENAKNLYKALLKEAKIDDKRIDAILKVTDVTTLKVDKEGKLENAKELSEAIKTDWKDFIVTNENRGTNVETPPAEGNGNTKTKEEIMKIKNTEERQKAIAENMELFAQS